VFEHSPAASIDDENYDPIETAIENKADYDNAVDNRDHYKDGAEADKQRADGRLRVAGKIAIGLELIPGEDMLWNRDETPKLATIKDEVAGFNQSAAEMTRLSENSEQDREDVLIDASDHLDEYRDVYEQAAIEDATKAGHDINLGGEHYPAQTVETPKQ
jgi:hypothetical protein